MFLAQRNPRIKVVAKNQIYVKFKPTISNKQFCLLPGLPDGLFSNQKFQ
jgi:hypothetical protein